MEDAWRAKCGPAWSPQPPETLAPSSSSVLPASASAAQVVHPTFSFQGTSLPNHSAAQVPQVFRTCNIDFANPGKTEQGNSFLALLSANPQRLPSKVSQFAKLHAHAAGVVNNCASLGTEVSCIPPALPNSTNVSIWNARNPLFLESRPSLLANAAKGSALQNSYQAANPYGNVSASSKPVPVQALQSIVDGRPPTSSNWTVSVQPKNTRQHCPMNIQENETLPKIHVGAASVIPSHNATHYRGRPRVICMNTVGELFLSELGLLGVTCFCHNIQMSVANFCEHSGSSANPGEAAHLENGMTIAHWRKLCFGNNAPDDCKGWDWSGGPSTNNGYVGSMVRSFPSSHQDPGRLDSAQSFVGLGKSGDSWNTFAYAKPPSTEVQQAAMLPPGNKNVDSNYMNNRLLGKGLSSPSQSHLPVLAKNHSEHPDRIYPKASQAILSNAEQNTWSHLFKNSVCNGEVRTPSPFYRHPSANSRNSSGSEAYMAARNGNSSNVDLQLGQPSQFQTSLNSLSTAENPKQVDAPCNLPKPKAKFPLTEETQTRTGLWCTSFGSSLGGSEQPQDVIGSIKSGHSEAKELAQNTNTSSLISLFLSHLNAERSTASHLSTILNGSKYSMYEGGKGMTSSIGCYQSEHISEINSQEKRNDFFDQSVLSNDDKHMRKQRKLPEKGSSHTITDKYMSPTMKTADSRVFVPAFDRQCTYGDVSANDRIFSRHFNHPDTLTQAGPGSVNFDQNGKFPGVNNMGHSNCVANSSRNSGSHLAARIGPLNSGTPMSLTPSISLNISETTPLAQTKSNNFSQHLIDDNVNFLALKHMAELCRQEQPINVLEASPRHQRFCCHQGMELQRNICKSDTVEQENFGQGTCCDLKNASQITGRSGCCKCTTWTPEFSACVKEQNNHICRACFTDQHSCLRLGRMSNYPSGTGTKFFDPKELNTSSHGRSCCSMLADHLTGRCLAGGFSPSDPINKQNACGKATDKHFAQNCNEVHTSRKRRIVDLCECSNKHIVMENNCHTGFWRDVPSKKIGQMDAASVSEPAWVLKPSKVTGNRSEAACKKFDGSQQMFDSVNEHQLSNVCNGSSTPAITEVSMEVAKVNYCPINIEDSRTASNFVADEGSGVEKCGSSDEALDNRGCREDLAAEPPVGSGNPLLSQSSCDVIDQLRQETSSIRKKVKGHKCDQRPDQGNVKRRKVISAEKRREPMKINKLSRSVPKSALCEKISESSHCINHIRSTTRCEPKTITRRLSGKRKGPSLRSIELLTSKENSHNNTLELDKLKSVDHAQSIKQFTISSAREESTLHSREILANEEGIHLDSEKPLKYVSINHIAKSNIHQPEILNKKLKPVVSGKSGIISNGGMTDQRKPPKIISLSLILTKSKRCNVTECVTKSKRSPLEVSRKRRLKAVDSSGIESSFNLESEDNDDKRSSFQLESENKDDNRSSSQLESEKSDFKRNATSLTSVHKLGKDNSNKVDEHIDEFSVIRNEVGSENNTEEHKISRARRRYKDVRRCSLSEILGKDEHATKSSKVPKLGANFGSAFGGGQPNMSPLTINSLADVRSLSKCQDTNGHACEDSQMFLRSGKVENYQTDLCNDATCCVCGSSTKEDFNCILECNRCLIKVHQACYGVPKVPRGHWLCRPCKFNSLNTACVLCGYEGGAMTKAVKGQTIVKNLLKAWESMKSVSSFSSAKSESAGACEASKCSNSGSLTSAAVELTSEKESNYSIPKGLQLCNSITAGMLDPSVTQWVHMVCGLWTPGTRCPNVDTMSAFDVSGASAPRKSTVCSMCNRPGGCCIQCRVLNCSVQFHPWCAHLKGLLQSEIEGDDSDKVGFYGRCVLHAAKDGVHVDNHLIDSLIESPNDWSCARTEGYKGRKSEAGIGFNSNQQRLSDNDRGGCISQEQINAWLHINGQRSCARAVVKPHSEIEHDLRKEYFRYKQLKAWKHLVVYKSGIHALGLYTSQLIAQGAMVVEYVGEVVGLRVADKREIEYQSGRRIQYKSACYFFRIDKEHIIDATRKGGIARFVNHSCQPNCVAKVISIRNEKKVVFFAVRDINPGEEITYDYHFNREDEGQKIPCYCNSKNCRRYLN